MTADEASRERVRLWAALKPLLVRSLGAEGAAEWLAFAAKQVSLEAQREPVTLPQAGWTP